MNDAVKPSRQPQGSSLSQLEQAGRIALPAPEPMPMPDHRLRLPMRDGVRLDTQVWLPQATRNGNRVPGILLRTPYKESVLGFRRLGVLRYVEAGYALVIQQIRGIGASEGRFMFSAPHERTDGYDTVEWIAAQAWCSGAVGMDGSSYLAITQLFAATEQPPHLRCIIPAVPSVDYFREVPYSGGIFSRQHTINWLRLLQIDRLDELDGGFMGVMPTLSKSDILERMTRRPAIDAADDVLRGDFLGHYREALSHPTFDDWFGSRTLTANDYARIRVPTLVVGGNFDLCIGALGLWKGLEEHGDSACERHLLIGPWDHGQAYSGGAGHYGPYDFSTARALDLQALRLAFFDQHLRGVDPNRLVPGRVTLFVTGANEWRTFDRYPPAESGERRLFLASGGRANSIRGDGALRLDLSEASGPPDELVDDPHLPFIAAIAAAHELDEPLDLRERERHHETLVYDSGPLTDDLVLLGEAQVELITSADAPDADVVVWLAEHRNDGRTVRLAHGQLRLRYREGFDRERLLEPGVPVTVKIPLTYVAHRVPAGSRLRLLIAGSNFPWGDPNPHTGEQVATAIEMRSARQWIYHDSRGQSRLILPVLGPAVSRE